MIGGSSGSFEVLSVILPAFSADPPSPPALVVLHVPPDRPSGIAPLFDARCAANICEAEDKEPLEPGTVYFGPPNYHLMVASGWISLSVDPPVNFCRPSIDVLFESAGTAFGEDVTAILLSGANHDGAAGLAAIAASGGRAIVQDPHSAITPAMPAAGLASCPAAEVMTVDEIAALIARLRYGP